MAAGRTTSRPRSRADGSRTPRRDPGSAPSSLRGDRARRSAPPRSKLAEERRLGLDLARAVCIDQMARHSTIVAPEPDSGSGYADLVTSSINLLTIRGIRIGINWSWLVIFGLIVDARDGRLSEPQRGTLGRDVPRHGARRRRAFFCRLAHELGHAFQAQHEGTKIDGITLGCSGAGSSAMFLGHRAEFRIAIAGPPVSLAIVHRVRSWRAVNRPTFDGVSPARLHQPAAARVQPPPGAAARRRPGPRAPRSGRRREASAGRPRSRQHRPRDRRPHDRRGHLHAALPRAGRGAWFILIGWFLVSAASSELLPHGARRVRGCACATS